MSFSTPSMNPEISATTATQQYVNMPRINSPFNAYNMQQTAFISIDKNCPVGTAKVKAFSSTHMPSPWNTAQYMQSQHMQGQSQQHCSTQKPTTWGTSTLPPVDIEVLSTPEPVTQQNTKYQNCMDKC